MRKPAVVQQIQAPEPDKFEAHAEIYAAKLDLKDLDLDERAFLGTCQDLYRNDRGTGTPFENFVHTIIRWTTWGNPPKPEDLIDEIKDNFQLDWDLTVHSVKRFLQHYPDLVSIAPAESPATPEPPAAPETTQPLRKGTTGRPRARKPRKKAASAA